MVNMARPSITGETIVVVIDGDVLTWTDGLLSGTNHDLVSKAHWVSDRQLPVDLTAFGPTVSASLTDIAFPERALAAMLGVKPGRGRIITAPEQILNMLPFDIDTEDGEDNPAVIV